MRWSVLAGILIVFAGCAGPIQQVAQEVDDISAPEPFVLEMPDDDCFVFHNIPFTDVGWPNRFLPPGYHAADASSVWGMPVNFEFSAVGMGIMGCEGEDPWIVGMLHVLIVPPSIEGANPVAPTSDPSPMTATDGGFNMYALEWYAEGTLYEELLGAGYPVIETSFDVEWPTMQRIVNGGDIPNAPAQADGFWTTTDDISVTISDDQGERSTFGNDLEIVWNHRNFDFRFFTDTPNGTAVFTHATGPDHLLVGRGTCTHRPDTDAHTIFTTMPYLVEPRQRTAGDCPDDGLGAFWYHTDSPPITFEFLHGVHAA